MGTYHYQYLDLKGKKQTGRIEAVSVMDAKEKLRRQGMLILSLSAGAGKQKKEGWKKAPKLQKNSLYTFTTQLSQLLAAGVPLYESLLSLEEQHRGEKYHSTLHSLCDQIKGGSSLSSALQQFPDSFNRLYCAMVAAGESVGALDQTLDKLAVLLKKQAALRKQIVTALLYPFVLAGFSCIVVLMLLTFVIPSLEAIFEGKQVNHFTSIVMSFSHFLRDYWGLYLPLIGALCVSVLLFLKSPKGKKLWHAQLLKTPFIKTLIIQAALARFCRTMGTLLQGGVSILNALQIARQVMRNPLLEEIIEKAEKKIVEGSLLSIELKKSPQIPTLVHRMLAIGEEGGNTSVMLQKIAEVYEEETEKNLTRVMALAQPVILLVMGGVVGIIMLAVLLPLTDVNAFLQG